MSMQHGISGSMWNKWCRQRKEKAWKVKKIQKVLKESTVDDLLEDLEVQLPSFFILRTCVCKATTGKTFQREDGTSDRGRGSGASWFCWKSQLQVPGRSSVSTLEPRSSYSVHCCNLDKVWSKDSCCESHVSVSDDLKHDKTSVAEFMSKVVNDLVKGKHPVTLWLCTATNGSCKHKQTILLIHKSVHWRLVYKIASTCKIQDPIG